MKHFFCSCLGILLLTMVICTTIYFPDLIQQSDFLSSFYVAGKLCTEGKAQDLYPNASCTLLTAGTFDQYAHQFLPNFSPNLRAVYMYPPLMAFLFEPISFLSPQIAFLLWQIFSIAAFALCSFLFASLFGKSWTSYFWSGILFFPIFQTIYIGHIGIILGLIPLSLGYWCYMRGHPAIAGLIWSLLLLKLQFLPMVLLLIGSLFLSGQLSCAIAFGIGTLIIICANVLCFGPGVANEWLLSLKLSDAIFSDPRYKYPTYLVSSLPAAVMQLVPFQWRAILKMVLYFFALLISIHAIWTCWRLFKNAGKNCLSCLSAVFVLGAFLLPLISPHLLFYDLSVLALASIIIYEQPFFRIDQLLKRDLFLFWIFIDAYFVAIMFGKTELAQPALLVIILGWFYIRVLKILQTQTVNQIIPIQ